MSAFIIAELGAVPEGRLSRMLNLIDVAAVAGCNAVKNQWMSDPATVRQRRTSGYASYDWLNYPIPAHAYCQRACTYHGLAYGCSTYLAEDIARVDPYVSFHKRSSFEQTDDAWIRAAVKTGKRVIVSAGMMEHQDFVDWLAGLPLEVEVLGCTSAYPTPLESAQIRTVSNYDLEGYSDHTTHPLAGALAVSQGAKVLEVHICLEDTPASNPDRAAALTPEQLIQYVKNVREAEALLGDGLKRIEPAEQPMLRYRSA